MTDPRPGSGTTPRGWTGLARQVDTAAAVVVDAAAIPVTVELSPFYSA